MPPPVRLLHPNDKLYRRLEPQFWNHETGEIYDTAFLDAGKTHTSLSVYVDKVATPGDTLKKLGQFSYFRNLIGTGKKKPTPKQYVDKGFGVAVFTVQQVRDLGLDFETDEDGNQYEPNGHVNIIRGQEHAVDLMLIAIPVPKEEIT